MTEKVTVIELRSGDLSNIAKGFAKRFAWIVSIYLIFAVVAVYLHWYVGTKDTPSTHRIKQWYLLEDPQNGKVYHRASVDWQFPITYLGVILGVISARAWAIELLACAPLISFGVAGLIPIYERFFPETRLPLKPPYEGRSDNLVLGFIFGTLQCAFFAFVARTAVRHFKHLDNRPSENSPPVAPF